MSDSPAGAGAPSAFAIAERWYFDLLRREIEDKGPAEAAQHLRHFVALSLEPDAKDAFGQPLRLALHHRVTECSVRLNRNSGALISWYLDFLAKEGDTTMPAADALQLALKTAAPPPDARLAQAAYETMADRTFFRARWNHEHEGLPVEGDYIEVLVNGKFGKVFALSRVWRAPNLGGQAAEL